ncbi:hypothetical protein ACOMHN_062413 [Nucella lapillus]
MSRQGAVVQNPVCRRDEYKRSQTYLQGEECTFYEERDLVARSRASLDSDVENGCVSPKVPGWTMLQPRQSKRDAPSSSFCLHGGHRCPKLSIPSRGCWRALRWVPHLLHAKCSNLHELF